MAKDSPSIVRDVVAKDVVGDRCRCALDEKDSSSTVI